jgi:F-box/WD-40 domain protein MET30
MHLGCNQVLTRIYQALDVLPVEEQAAVNAVWSNFSAATHQRRALILHGLLTMCCFSQLSLLSGQLAHLIRLDPFAALPREVALQVLACLDATSLCRAAQVSRAWRALADDDVLWRGICEQHIGQKCRKCGWGLPVLERRRTVFRIPSFAPSSSPVTTPQPHDHASTPTKRELEEAAGAGPPLKRLRLSPPAAPLSAVAASAISRPASPAYNPLIVPATPGPSRPMATRPWKDVYCERLTIERNWRRGKCTVRTLKGHTDRVMCLQFSDTLAHPAFPILMTGSYDRTVRIWNMETGAELRCLRGHTRGVRALQFDACKLITGSMDHTLRVWDWRTGRCVRTLEGHTEGVVALHFDDTVLASGSVDATVRVWDLRTGSRFTLHGHRDWVNAVLLWDPGAGARPAPAPALGGCADADTALAGGGAPRVDAGKMLFSASDDSTVRLWDLARRECIRVFAGHVGQVQAIRIIPGDAGGADPHGAPGGTGAPRKPLLVSGSLDNTARVWDIETGQVTRTLFGHIEGIWAAAGDKSRLVTGSHDRTIKVWSLDEGKCLATIVGHRGAVTCLAMSEDRLVSGSDDSDVMIWSFTG